MLDLFPAVALYLTMLIVNIVIGLKGDSTTIRVKGVPFVRTFERPISRTWGLAWEILGDFSWTARASARSLHHPGSTKGGEQAFLTPASSWSQHPICR